MVNIGSYGTKNAESCIYESPKEIKLGVLFLLSILNLRMQGQSSIRMMQVNSTIRQKIMLLNDSKYKYKITEAAWNPWAECGTVTEIWLILLLIHITKRHILVLSSW
jgi:hypothetical protein